MKKIIIFYVLLIFYTSSLFSQSIELVNPNSGVQGEELMVSISGQNTNFGQGTSTTEVWFSQGSSTVIYPSNVDIESEISLEADFKFTNFNNIGFYDVNVSNPIDGLVTLYDGFYLYPNPNPPYLVSVEPNSAAPGESLTVDISGQNTNFGQGTSTTEVWFTQGTSTIIHPENIGILSQNVVEAHFSFEEFDPVGDYNVNVWNSYDGHMILYDAFNLDCTPIPPDMPIWPTTLCINPDNTSYSTVEIVDVLQYVWSVTPFSAGELESNEIYVTVNWSDTFEGVANLKVKAVNECGFGNYSEALTVTISDNETVAGFDYEKVGLVINFYNTSYNADTYIWDFGDQNTSTEISPEHLYSQDGAYSIQLIASSLNCGTDTISQTITVYGSYFSLLSTGSNDKIKITPNPSNGLFNLKIENSKDDDVFIDVFNINGQIVFSEKVLSDDNPQEIDLSEYSEGIYFYKVQGSNIQKIGKLIIK